MSDDDVSIARSAPEKELRGVLPIGTRLRDYEILSVLGQGSFGITYRARHLPQGRDVAIKEYFPAALALRDSEATVLPRSTEFAEEFVFGRDRFLEEQRTLARFVGVSAVVQVIDYIEAHGTAYMVMTLVEGETLDRRLKWEGRLSQASIERILVPLLEGLERIHAEGFLHRDIKPANIILDTDGKPTLIDFGAARAAMTGRTQTLTAILTPGYAPIEQFTSGKQGPFTDIYALGATLYQCVTGTVPPSAIDRMVGAPMQSATQLGRDNYDRKLLVGIDAALAHQTRDRPQSVAAWRAIFATGIGPQSDATRVIPAAKEARIRRRALWAVAVVLVLAGGGYFAFSRLAPQFGPSITQAATADRAEQERQKALLDAQAKELEAQRKAALEAQAKADEAQRKAAEDRARIEQELSAQQEAKRKADEEAKLRADQEKQHAEAVARAEAGEKELALTLETRQALQTKLAALGFDVGVPDGAFGARTRAAILAWQQQTKEEPTGFLTGKQVISLVGVAQVAPRPAPAAKSSPPAAPSTGDSGAGFLDRFKSGFK